MGDSSVLTYVYVCKVTSIKSGAIQIIDQLYDFITAHFIK